MKSTAGVAGLPNSTVFQFRQQHFLRCFIRLPTRNDFFYLLKKFPYFIVLTKIYNICVIVFRHLQDGGLYALQFLGNFVDVPQQFNVVTIYA